MLIGESKTRGLMPTIEPAALVNSVLLLNAKIKNGYYEFEETPCFCGSDDSKTVVTKDRYGIFYSLNLCLKCGILYASPRMTDESTGKFYQADYREIYDFGESEEDVSKIEKAAYEAIEVILKDHEIDPDVIFDIGCNDGSILSYFKGKKTYGVDIDKKSIEHGKRLGRSVIFGGIEKLEELDKKADLIILNHVLEHFSNLKENLDRISKLLSPDGFLYISVPGLYTWDHNTLMQNAHYWQFNTRTLTYVMNCCGWEALYADARINSIWRYTGVVNDDLTPVANQAKEIWDYKYSGKQILPTFDPTCKFPLKQRRENVKKTLSYKLKDLSDIHERESGKEAVIVSGGPSVNGYIDKIKEMQGEGKVIIAIERMYQWCQANDIAPDYVLVMDASDDVIESFDKIHPDTTHILATQCNEEIFDRLKDEDTYIYSSAQSNIHFVDEWEENKYERVTMLNTGGSVSLGCISVSMYLGMKKLHIFGFDCHVTKSNYADGITGVGCVKDIFTAVVDGKEYETTGIYVSFARQFFEMWKLGESLGLVEDIKIYGDSLAKAMSTSDIIDGDK